MADVAVPDPFVVQGTLDDASTVDIDLPRDATQWTLVEPESGTYNSLVAGTYVFAVDLQIDTDAYENPDSLKARVAVIVEKGEAVITADAVQTFVYDGTVRNIVASLNHTETELTYSPQQGYMDAGTYEINISAAETANYEAANATVTLEVAKATQTITFNPLADLRRDAGMVPLDVTASSGLPVELMIDDEEVATLNGTSLNVLRLGTVRITATQTGDANHEAAEPVTVTVRVTDPEAELPVRVSKVVSPNGDGINEYLIIEGVKDYPDNRVTVFNRNGTIIWEGSGYNNGTLAFRGIGTGQYNVPAGTYFYVAEINVNGEWKYEKGWFVLRY